MNSAGSGLCEAGELHQQTPKWGGLSQAEVGEGSHHGQAVWGCPLLPGDTALAWPHWTHTQCYSLEKCSSCGLLPVPVPPQQGCHPCTAWDSTWGAQDQGSPPSRCLLRDEEAGHVIPSSALIKEHLLCCQDAPEAPNPSSSSSSLPSRAAGKGKGKAHTDFGKLQLPWEAPGVVLVWSPCPCCCCRGQSVVGCACGGKERQCRPGGDIQSV